MPVNQSNLFMDRNVVSDTEELKTEERHNRWQWMRHEILHIAVKWGRFPAVTQIYAKMEQLALLSQTVQASKPLVFCYCSRWSNVDLNQNENLNNYIISYDGNKTSCHVRGLHLRSVCLFNCKPLLICHKDNGIIRVFIFKLDADHYPSLLASTSYLCKISM